MWCVIIHVIFANSHLNTDLSQSSSLQNREAEQHGERTEEQSSMEMREEQNSMERGEKNSFVTYSITQKTVNNIYLLNEQ